MMYILIGGMTVAFIKGELTIELLTVDPDRNNDAELKSKKGKQKAKSTDTTIKQSLTGLLMWTVAWLPEKQLKKI